MRWQQEQSYDSDANGRRQRLNFRNHGHIAVIAAASVTAGNAIALDDEINESKALRMRPA
jgi:hypothetical protein